MRLPAWPPPSLSRFLLAICVAALPLVVTASPTVSTIGIDEIERGQQGYGLSVFAGDEPERFEAEVIGVMRNVSPGVSYILARLSGHGLEESGVAAGMSGSPVYFDGRLAGAVAFSWPFTRGAIAGITPIDLMRAIPRSSPGEQPLARSLAAAPVSWPQLVRGEFSDSLLEDELGRAFRGVFDSEATPLLQWSAAGFGEAGSGILKRALGSVSVSGRSAAASGAGSAADGELVDQAIVAGGAVAALLIDGDLSLAATGTVTDVVDDQVLAFGHAFLGSGPVEMPMAAAEVLMVLSNLNSSFKVSNVGPVLGAFGQDRQAGIRGQIGREPTMLPLRLRLVSDRVEEYRVRLAPIPALTPALISLSVIGGLESSSYQNGLQGLDVEARFRIAGQEDLLLRQSFDGPSAVADVSTLLLAYAGFLLQNEFTEVDLEEVEIEVAQSQKPRTETLLRAWADRTVVEPGETVRIHGEWVPYRGEGRRRTLEVTVPEEVGPGKLYLFVGDGPSIDVARFTIEQAEPETFAQVLRRLRSFHSRKDLAVLAVTAAPGLAVGGESLPDLPGSIRALWGAESPTRAKGTRLAVVEEWIHPGTEPLAGVARIDLEVRPPRSVALSSPSSAEDSRP
ncbi:MAG: hypothetical protein AAF604_05125 [Acidobacteriota bacterium]